MTHPCPVDHFTHLVPWSEYAPPFRPAPADILALQHVIDDLEPRRVVLLGLTPEIAGCDWPAGVEFTAVDHSAGMIERMWPPPVVPRGARVACADWCEMPVPSESVDLVTGDGCLTFLTFDGWRRLAREVARVLKPGGRFVLRVFLRPDVSESVAAIARDLAAYRVGDINALKLRLLGAVHADGARLHDVWQAWSTMRRGPGPGYSAISLAQMERYQGSEARYFLGTDTETSAILGEELFQISSASPAGYPLCERCRTLVFRRYTAGEERPPRAIAAPSR